LLHPEVSAVGRSRK